MVRREIVVRLRFGLVLIAYCLTLRFQSYIQMIQLGRVDKSEALPTATAAVLKSLTPIWSTSSAVGTPFTGGVQKSCAQLTIIVIIVRGMSRPRRSVFTPKPH
jgi:hypothetical protein